MKTMYKVLFVALILFVPFISIIGASNIVLRMPDVYVYQFNETEFTQENDIELTNQDMAETISDFMFGKKENFQLQANYEGEKTSLFTTRENDVMQHFRLILDKSMIIFIVITIISISCFLVLFRGRRREALRISYKGATIFYMILIGVGLICFLVPPIRAIFYSFIFKYQLLENGTLALILIDQLAKKCVVAIIAISALILFLLVYLIRKIIQPRRMFKQHY